MVGDEEIISLSVAKVYVFSDCVLCLGKDEREPTIKYCLGRQVDVVHEFITEFWKQLVVSRWNSSGTFSQDSPH